MTSTGNTAIKSNAAWPLEAGFVATGFGHARLRRALARRWRSCRSRRAGRKRACHRPDNRGLQDVYARNGYLPIASLRGERDIAVGNAIGSCIFNLLAVLGLCSLIAPDGSKSRRRS